MQTKHIKRSLSILIVLGGLLFAATVSFGLYAFETRTSEDVKGVTAQVGVISANDSIKVEPSQFLITSPIDSPTEGQPLTEKKQIIPQLSLVPKTQSQQYVNDGVSDFVSPKPSSLPIPISTPTPSPFSQKHSVSVSIDSGDSFQLSIEQGKNHCDVLSQALSEGKLSSLNMQYNSTYNSYAVYQINGLGQEGQVWWKYSVNDKNPPLGCTHVQVQNNDKIRWIYVGPK